MIPGYAWLGGLMKAAARDAVEGFAGDLHVGLIISPFTPGEDLSALTAGNLGAAVGLDPLAAVAANRGASVDALTGEWTLFIQEPAGGWFWESAAPMTYPITVYGAFLASGDGTTPTYPDDLLATVAFDAPITLTAHGQFIMLDEVAFRLLSGAIR